METPIEILKNRLFTLRTLATSKGFLKNKKHATKMIPEFENAIKILESQNINNN
jgi:hypothetical protein